MENNDFFKNRKNRYSIRKMTAGAASIIGITLFGNANDAQAAEQTDNGDAKAQTTQTTQTGQPTNNSTKQTVGNNEPTTSENTTQEQQNTNASTQNSTNDVKAIRLYKNIFRTRAIN